METTNGALCATQSLASRIWHKLGFFARFDEPLFDWRQNVPEGGDLITNDTTVTLSWDDRLRVLLSGRCALTVWTKTEHVVGKTESRSQFCVMPPSAAPTVEQRETAPSAVCTSGETSQPSAVQILPEALPPTAPRDEGNM